MGVGTGLYMYNVVAKKFMFAISSPDEFLVLPARHKIDHFGDVLPSQSLATDRRN